MDEATISRIARSKEKMYASHSILMLGLLLVVWLAAPGMSKGLDNNGPQNLLCYKSVSNVLCQTSTVNCSWEAGHNADADYTLKFWYHNEKMDIRTLQLQPVKTSFIIFDQNTVYPLEKATIWVESNGSRLLVSENLTLQISKAIKFDPPSRNSISISRVNNNLTLMWPKPKCGESTMKKEARVRPRNHVEWTLGNCTSDDEPREKLVVICHLGENTPYEAQIRFRTSDWSSLWSDWSESVFIPTEILDSPKADYTLGQFGDNGQRNMTLEWEKPSAEHGDVSYILTFMLLPCSCEEAMVETLPLNSLQTSYQTALSSAGYNISLKVFNEAGSSLVQSLQLPPAQVTGTTFLNVSLSGKNFTLTWEAKMDTEVYCFEKQPLGKVLSQAPCDRTDSARNLYESSGTVEFNTCYRLAVHGFDRYMGVWSTFGFTYLFARNTSLEDLIHIRVTNQKPDSAVVLWKPPQALSACPGKLKKYIICYQHEQDREIKYYEANASERQYTILNLLPNTRYRVGVWAYTTGSNTMCKTRVPFLTSPADPKKMTLALSFLCLFGGILAIICIFHFGKKRVQKVLCPALPDPTNTEALKIFTRTETVQVQPEQGLRKFLESSSLLEPFTVEVLSAKEEPIATTTVDSVDIMKAIEETPLSKEVRMGSGNGVLPSEYKGQGFLSPLEDDCHGKEGFGEFAGISPEIGTGCSLLFADATEARDSQDLPLSLAPLSFRLLDKIVVIKNGDSSCDFSCSDDVSI